MESKSTTDSSTSGNSNKSVLSMDIASTASGSSKPSFFQPAPRAENPSEAKAQTRDEKAVAVFAPTGFARAKTYLSSSDRRQANQAWDELLENIKKLIAQRDLKKPRVFISYAWETDPAKNDKLQAWLKKLQSDLQAVGMEVFFDLSDMSGKLDHTMIQNIQDSDFILPIITPRFLERVKDEKSNLALEYRESLKKAESNPKCFIPLIYDGQFDFRTSFTGDLAKIPQFLMKDFKRGGDYQRNLTTLRPLGLVPEMLGIRIGDKEYQGLLDQWHETSLTRLPPSNPDFSGRADLFEKLYQGFKAAGQSKRDPVQVIAGLGGVGKTQLALEFAHRYQSEYEFVCWINADKETLESEFLRLAENLNIDTKGLELPEVQKKVHDALAKFTSWLIIFDNAENPQTLKSYLPKQHSATQHVLVTSRSTKWPQAKLALSTFSQQESIEYIQRFLPDTTVTECEQLATVLGNLPLALSHAVAYIIQTGYTIAQYLRRYQESGLQLLAKQAQTTKTTATENKSDGEEDDDFSYNQTILTTWQLSLAQIQKRSAQAEKCLMLCGYLYAEGITEEMLQKSLGVTLNDLDDLIIVLKDYSMISSAENGFKIHRLVQEVIQWKDKQAGDAIDVWTARLEPLATTLYNLYPFEKQTADFAKAKQLQPHLETVAEHLAPFVKPIKGQEDTAAVAQADLYSALRNLFLEVLGNPKKAIEYGEKALKIQLATLGDAHPAVGTSYNNLGNAYSTLGDVKKAIEYYEKDLKIGLATYGDAHPHVATSYSNLGGAYLDLGDAKKAIEYYEKALKIQLATFGEAHPAVADSYNSLGSAYRALGDAKKAIEYYEKALKIQLATLGDAHPAVGTSYNNLGNAYSTLGDVKKAIEYYEKDLKISLATYGDVHPKVAAPYNNLGGAYLELGDAKKAIEYYEKALKIALATYGDVHPKVAIAYNNLGVAYRELGDAKKAIEYYGKSLEIRLVTYGDAHPDVATSYNNLGLAYSELGDDKKAIDYQEKALKIALATYGDAHPTVATFYNNLGGAYSELGDAKKALEYYEQALKIRLAIYGDAHPTVATSYNNLGGAHSDLGDAKKAIEYHEKALKVYLATYGDSHPDVATSYSNLGQAYQGLGDAKKALEYYEKDLKIQLATYGDAHPNVAGSYSNLGLAYSDLGNPKKAIEYHEKSLKIKLTTYGDAHPFVATSYNNLGLAYSGLGNAKKALEYYEKALRIFVATYGDSHPYVAVSYKNLGNAYNNLNDSRVAMNYFEKARQIFLTAYDDKHPRMAQVYNGIGNTYRISGDLPQAIEYHQKALKIRLEKFIEKNPDVAETYHDLGKDYLALKDREKALFNFEKALSIYSEINPEHPKIAKVKMDLVAVQHVSQATHPATMFGASALQASRENVAEKADALNVVNADTHLQEREEQQLRSTARTSGCCLIL